MELKKIHVLVVDDSSLIRSLLSTILRKDPQITIIGTANNGEEALKIVKRDRPDVVTMDIHMPGMDGFETTRQIMQLYPVPVVIVSGFYNTSEVATAFKAVEAGAVTILSRPPGPESPDFQESSRKFIQTIKLMAEIKVIRRYSRPVLKTAEISPILTRLPETSKFPELTGKQIMVIGASAGGPQALQVIIKGLPNDFPMPVIIVQHIDSGFAEGFAVWLKEVSGKRVILATNGTKPQAGNIYLPPGDFHIGLGPDGKIMLKQETSERGIRPSVSYLFRSVLRVYGNRVLAILLSGMGKDGAAEMKMLKDAGSITIAQDAGSSLVHGMPGEAIRIGGANLVLSPEQIIEYLQDNYMHA